MKQIARETSNAAANSREDARMDSPHWSRVLTEELRNISLRDVLEWHGLTVQQEGVSFRARGEHHNIVVTGTRWFDNKAGIGGGGAIDLCRYLTGSDFRTACRILAEEVCPSTALRHGIFPSSQPVSAAEPTRVPFLELAARYARRAEQNWPAARAYLVDTRGIEPAIVDHLHEVGSIYADHRPNPSLVFLHRTPAGRVQGATLRDTRHDSAFRPCLGDKLCSWFVVGDLANATRVVAVESHIDALSYWALWTLWAPRADALAVASCAGSVVPTELMWHACEHRQPFVVALDNDSAGERGWQKAWDETVDWPGFKISSECPQRKDWNDDLRALSQRRQVMQTAPANALKP